MDINDKNEPSNYSYEYKSIIGFGKIFFLEINEEKTNRLNKFIQEKMETNKGEIIVPDEILRVIETDKEAKEFFNNLSVGYKKGYCDWVGGAKQQATRETRAEKALIMLQRKQKTLKT